MSHLFVVIIYCCEMIVFKVIRWQSRLATRYILVCLFCAFYFGPLKSQSQRVIYSETERQTILSAHNQERRLVGNQDLIWDYDLEEFAADWASTLSSRGSGLSHRPNNKYGENCYWSSTSYVSPDAAILCFNEEKEMYNYGPVSYQNFRVTGHYTQVVWYRTTKVGCAAVSGNSGTYVVCNYNPPGNLIGDYPYRKENNKVTTVNVPSPPINQSVLESESSTPIPPRAPVLIPTRDEPVKSQISRDNSQILRSKVPKNNETRPYSQSFVVMFSGIESWTKFQNTPIISQLKSKREIGFTGASPHFQLISTLPKNRNDKVRDIRGMFSVGFTLSNRILQEDLNQCLGVIQSEPRLYSPINYEFGLQCWRYFQVSLGQTLFGLMATSNTWDYAVLYKCSLRFIVPMGRDFTFSLNASTAGQQFDVSNWNMASVGFSLRSKFY